MFTPVLCDDAIPRPAGWASLPLPADALRAELAIAAARHIAEGGLDYRSAKQRAIEEVLGEQSPPRNAVPDNADVDEALRQHLALFDPAHPQRVARMRRTALRLMDTLADFQPYLTGAVWKGIVSEHAPIHVQLFHDDGKEVQIHLLNLGLEIEVTELPHFRGEGRFASVEALCLSWEDEPVLLSLYSVDDLRGALRGQPAERGSRDTVEALLAATPAASA